MYRLVSYAMLASFLAAPAAANMIGSVTAAPSEVEVGDDVTIIVTRAGFLDCAAQVDFGDGTPPQGFTLTQQPAEFTHAYDSAGDYTVVASSGRGVIPCQESAEDTVKVVGGRSGGPAWRQPPATEGYKGPSRQGKPGWKDLPIKEGYQDTPLAEVLSETRLLSLNDPAVQVVSCGADGNYNQCNNVVHDASDCAGPLPFVATSPAVSPVAISSSHLNCGTFGDDTGTDHYQINLANGWYINQVVDIGSKGSSSSDWATVSAIPTGKGVSTADITVNWLASPHDGVAYWVGIEIKGPQNTSPF